MLAFVNIFLYEFLWREATVRKCEAFSNLALNSYPNFKRQGEINDFKSDYTNMFRRPKGNYTSGFGCI